MEVLESLGADVTVIDEVFDADPVGDFLTMTGVCHLAHPAAVLSATRAGSEVHPVLRHSLEAAQATTGRAGLLRPSTAST